MDSPEIVAILISVAALFAFVNHRRLRLHPTVGIMLQALLASVLWLGLEHFWPAAHGLAVNFRRHINLNEALFHWLLGPLLFAAALQVDLHDLRSQWGNVSVLAIVGTLISTFLIAGLAFGLLHLAGIFVPFISCAVFGAIISPTDPVAVMGFFKTIIAPRDLVAIVGGESLFNDGIGVVLFTVLAQAHAGQHPQAAGMIWSFFSQTIGGAGIGLAAGAVVYQMLKRVDNYQVEILLTLALALGGYTLADALHVSGPIAAVVAGLIIGNHGRMFAVSETTRRHLDDFWELIDETLNAVLFLLVGLVVLETQLSRLQLLISLVAIVIVLLARCFSVWVSTGAIAVVKGGRRTLRPNSVAILTWGGLRGGLAIAMALSLSPGRWRDLIVATTYGVVVFSVLVQGSTLRPMFAMLLPKAERGHPPESVAVIDKSHD